MTFDAFPVLFILSADHIDSFQQLLLESAVLATAADDLLAR